MIGPAFAARIGRNGKAGKCGGCGNPKYCSVLQNESVKYLFEIVCSPTLAISG